MARAESPPLSPVARRWTLAGGAACLLSLLPQLPASAALAVATIAVVSTALAWRRPMPAALRFVLALSLVGIVLGLSGFRLGRDT
ncbi:MAG: DUF3488 domain-containing protein, partial [Luteimonas sp.]|nr:DUF3488 domain-containing protein [Luteimonas sp.]